MTIVEMCVHMDCAGCESKIRKTLQKLEGVDSVEIYMPSQKVIVTGSLDQRKILKAVRRTGRRAVFWPNTYNTQLQTQHAVAVTTNTGLFNENPSSSYNYYKHGYDDSRMHYGDGYAGHSAVNGERTGDVFSDENPHGCSVM